MQGVVVEKRSAMPGSAEVFAALAQKLRPFSISPSFSHASISPLKAIFWEARHRSMLLTGNRISASTGRQLATNFSRPYGCQACNRIVTSDLVLRHRSLSRSNNSFGKRRRELFSSNSALRQPQIGAKDGEQQQAEVQEQKRKAKRSPHGKNSLRSVAVEAQRSKAGNELKKSATAGLESETQVSTFILVRGQR